MTNQEAFDKIVKWFSRPNAVFGMAEKGQICRYRVDETPDGLGRCAVGCLIPPSQYKPELEGYLPGEIEHEVPALKGLDTEFLASMQDYHDTYAVGAGTIDEFVKKLREWGKSDEAKKYGITA